MKFTIPTPKNPEQLTKKEESELELYRQEFSETTEPASSRNLQIYESVMNTRENYLLQIICGPDVSNQSVAFESHIRNNIIENLLDAPYLMIIRLSSTGEMVVKEEHQILELMDSGNKNQTLMRFAHIYNKYKTGDYESDSQEMALTVSFGLESLYLEGIDPSMGSTIIENMETSDMKEKFLYWVGTKIPILWITDEISTKDIFPASNMGHVDDDKKNSIAGLREKCKANIYPEYYGVEGNIIKPYLLITSPENLPETPLITEYRNKLKKGQIELLKVDKFQEKAIDTKQKVGTDANGGDIFEGFTNTKGKGINYRFNGTTNIILFADDEGQVNEELVKSAFVQVIGFPNTQIRKGLVLSLFHTFLENNPSKTSMQIEVILGSRETPVSPGDMDDIVSKLAGLSSRQIREIITSQLTIGKNYALIDGNHKIKLFTETVSDHRKKMVEQTVGLKLVENKLEFDDLAGLKEVKAFFKKIIGILGEKFFHQALMKGIMLIGPPGTGKTFLAHIFMNEARKKGYTGIEVDIGAAFGKYVGESEMKTRQIIQTIEATKPSIVWTDELDRKLPDTELKTDGGGGSDTSNRVATQFMETWGDPESKGEIIYVGGTNNPKNIPTATMDRFPIRIPILPPDEAGKTELFELKLKKIQQKIPQIDYQPSLKAIAQVMSTVHNVGGRPIEGIIDLVIMSIVDPQSPDEVIVDKETVEIIMTTMNIKYGDKNEQMIKDALSWAHPLTCLSTLGVLKIIEYTKAKDIATRQTFKPILEKIKIIIKNRKTAKNTFINDLAWDLDIINKELDAKKKSSQTSFVKKDKPQPTL